MEMSWEKSAPAGRRIPLLKERKDVAEAGAYPKCTIGLIFGDVFFPFLEIWILPAITVIGEF